MRYSILLDKHAQRIWNVHFQTFDRQGLRSFTNWTRSSIVSITLNKQVYVSIQIQQGHSSWIAVSCFLDESENSEQTKVYTSKIRGIWLKKISFKGNSYHLRYCQVVQNLFTVAAQLSHLCVVKHFVCKLTSLNEHWAELCLCVVYCKFTWEVSKLMMMMMMISMRMMMRVMIVTWEASKLMSMAVVPWRIPREPSIKRSRPPLASLWLWAAWPWSWRWGWWWWC